MNNHYISDDGIIANAFNIYFINVGSSLAKNIRSDINPLLYVQNIESSLNIPEINTHEISTIISAIANSASGYDELPASILKQCCETYIEPLTYLINMSIAQGIFPEPLKITRIITIFNGENEQSYRIIDQYQCYPFFQIFLKKIVAAYATEFLEDNHIFLSILVWIQEETFH